ESKPENTCRGDRPWSPRIEVPYTLKLGRPQSAAPTCLIRIQLIIVALVIVCLLTVGAQAQGASSATGALKIITGNPGSVVFINNVRHGVTDESGALDLPRIKAGAYPVRVRTVGFADWKGSVVVVARSKRELKVVQKPTSDQAELHYQKGDQLRDSAKNEEAVEEYRKAIALRKPFPEARVAMTRSLITLQDFQEAEKQIQAALKEKTPYVEAQTVLANMRRNQGLVEEAIAEYRKALRLARGNAFEAHIGLAIALNELSQSDDDPRLVDEIVREYRIGIAQDMETEPVLYYQLGEILEKANRKKEAIEAYRNYLRLDPEGQYASAVESIIEQLKQGIDKK
ncbi:MAG: tetratricopeptide repeat protein, partial [Acidobacteriota bacterium]